jgi:phenylalanyl-tRNA synthetase alpha chain
MLEKINHIKTEAQREIGKSSDLDNLRELEIKYLGRKSDLNSILRSLASLDEEERRQIGPAANALKKELEEAISLKRKSFVRVSDIDLTLPGIAPKIGHKHPLTQFLEKVEDVFVSMGFEVVDGPEIESDEYNFDLLNIPKEHPARDMWDTYYIKNSKFQIPNSDPAGHHPKGDKFQTLNSKLLLRTHTSPVQLRAMETRKPPVRIIVPGRVFRHEATDAGHEKNFYQCEGFVIDKNVSLANLISTLRILVKRIFGEKIEIRVRPSYFPFVEPGIEVDMSCLICNGKGCSACKQSGWVEVLGAGMIHPKVLENMAKVGGKKWNPKEYSGFAFGLGIDRFAMLYYGINDIRLFYSGDLRFVKQF